MGSGARAGEEIKDDGVRILPSSAYQVLDEFRRFREGEDLPIPKPEPGGLLVRVEACAICGTDLKMFLKGDPRVPVGQTIGHEFVGDVIEAFIIEKVQPTSL